MEAPERIHLASTDWEAPDKEHIRFLANAVSGSMGQDRSAAELMCLISVPSQPLLPKFIPYGVLTIPQGGFFRKKLTYRHVLNHQLLPEVWNDKIECEMSLKNAISVAGEHLARGSGEDHDLAIADGEQRYTVTDRQFAAVYYDLPAMIGYEVVRTIIISTEGFFARIPVIIYGYKQGSEERWELRIPGWLDTFAIMSDRRKAEEAADGLTYHIGIAALTTSIAKLVSGPEKAEAIQNARACVGLVTNFGRMYSGMEPLQIQ